MIAALGVIRQNIAFSHGVKAMFVVLTLAGYSSMWAAVAADKVLTFQTDSVLCSMSPWRVDHFLQ